MHSFRPNHARSRWAHCNTPAAKLRRRAARDAAREAATAGKPPAYAGPEPLSHWQRVVVDLYVPTHGRSDQWAAVIDGQRVGLLSATAISVRVRQAIQPRPSKGVLADWRRES